MFLRKKFQTICKRTQDYAVLEHFHRPSFLLNIKLSLSLRMHENVLFRTQCIIIKRQSRLLSSSLYLLSMQDHPSECSDTRNALP
jgi:hypothetical protein